MSGSCRLCPHGPGGAAAHTRPGGTAGPLGRAAGWAAGRGKSYKSGSMRKVRPAGVACEVPSRWAWDGQPLFPPRASLRSRHRAPLAPSSSGSSRVAPRSPPTGSARVVHLPRAWGGRGEKRAQRDPQRRGAC